MPSDLSQLVLVGEFHFYSPHELFEHFTVPANLVRWWPQEASTDPMPGGKYVFRWPSQGWVLSGAYTSFEPGQHLGFTWSWNHGSEEVKPLQVDIYFLATEEGSRMSIFHGPFVGEDAKERDGIKEGWIHFSMILAGLRRSTDDA